MLHGVSLDQLHTFIAAADEGSFSAAGRRLRRAQSVVSKTLANLEGQLGVKLFDRSGRLPVLTDQGRALLADARAVAGNVELLKAQARSLAGGLEPELSVAVDIMFPDAAFAAAVADFQREYPTTLLRFDVESSAVVDPVLNGRCSVGVVGSWSVAPPQLTHEALLTVPLPMVVSSRHPLATYRRPISLAVLDEYVHLTSHRPRKYLARPDIRVAACKSLAAFSSWGQTCLPARRSRVWRVTPALGRSGFGKWLTRSDRERRRTALRPRDNYVGDLSSRQPAGPSRTLVHRAPQAKAHSPVARENDLSGGFEGVGLEAPRST